MAHRKPSESYLSTNTDGLPESSNPPVRNIFRNDGSFLEMFKKMQNASQDLGAGSSSLNVESKESDDISDKDDDKFSDDQLNSKPAIGRRKTRKTLPVGKVKKLKTVENEPVPPSSGNSDAWAKYLAEVKKYKETYCESETKNRSLVK